MPATCYPALRRLPGRDSHPLEKRSKARRSPDGVRLRRHGAPPAELTPPAANADVASPPNTRPGALLAAVSAVDAPT
jgi:hypothetical protein